MGCYVNPPVGSKEEFLSREGMPIPMPVKWSEVPEGHLPVILCDNIMFTAAGVAYSERELSAFQDPSDTRRKRAYIVSIDKLRPVALQLDDYMREPQ